jgi:hypothetical protein
MICDQIALWKMQRESRSLFVMMNPHKNGSEQYFYSRVKDLLPPHQVATLETDFNGTEIVCIDDAALSGNNLAGGIEEFLGDNKPKCLFTIITAVGTDFSIKCFSRVQSWHPGIRIRTFFHKKMQVIDELEIDTPLNLEFAKQISPHTEHLSSFPVHFEHKIPNQFGSFPEIYRHGR